MRIEQRIAQDRQILFARWIEIQLMRIGPAFAPHGKGLAAPDELRAALAKMFPATNRVVGRMAIARGVPALHGMDRPAIADGPALQRNRLRQRRLRSRGEFSVKWNFDAKLLQILRKSPRFAKASNGSVAAGSHFFSHLAMLIIWRDQPTKSCLRRPGPFENLTCFEQARLQRWHIHALHARLLFHRKIGCDCRALAKQHKDWLHSDRTIGNVTGRETSRN